MAEWFASPNSFILTMRVTTHQGKKHRAKPPGWAHYSLVGPSTILPDVSTITIPSYLLGCFYHSIYFYPFSIRIDPKRLKIPLTNQLIQPSFAWWGLFFPWSDKECHVMLLLLKQIPRPCLSTTILPVSKLQARSDNRFSTTQRT